MNDVLDEFADCIPALRRYACALTGDGRDADDLVQDCLERAIRKRRLWRPSGSVQAWLFKILLNLYRNNLRDEKKHSHLVSIDELERPDAVLPSQDDQQSQRLALSETAQALLRLPDEQREALLLVAVEGFDYAQAADILAVPIGTLMSRISRARTTLRKLTQEEKAPRMRSVT